MKRFLCFLFLWFMLFLGSIEAKAASIGLFDYAFNIDGTIYEIGDSLPGILDASDFDFSTGLGSISITIDGEGDHYVLAFFDHEIDEEENTYFNEVGSATGTPAPGQSWEIDEPGWVDGDIYQNFRNNSLDNSIGISIWGNTDFPDDVSMAMGWVFTLDSILQRAIINFTITEIIPTSGFYLTQSLVSG